MNYSQNARTYLSRMIGVKFNPIYVEAISQAIQEFGDLSGPLICDNDKVPIYPVFNIREYRGKIRRICFCPNVGGMYFSLETEVYTSMHPLSDEDVMRYEQDLMLAESFISTYIKPDPQDTICMETGKQIKRFWDNREIEKLTPSDMEDIWSVFIPEVK